VYQAYLITLEVMRPHPPRNGARVWYLPDRAERQTLLRFNGGFLFPQEVQFKKQTVQPTPSFQFFVYLPVFIFTGEFHEGKVV
jgi:hypothetical protein